MSVLRVVDDKAGVFLEDTAGKRGDIRRTRRWALSDNVSREALELAIRLLLMDVDRAPRQAPLLTSLAQLA